MLFTVSCDLSRPQHVISLRSSKSFQIMSLAPTISYYWSCKEGRSSEQQQAGSGCCHSSYNLFSSQPIARMLEVTIREVRLLQAAADHGAVLGCKGTPRAHTGREVRSMREKHLRRAKCTQPTFSAHVEGHRSERSPTLCFQLRQHSSGNKDVEENKIFNDPGFTFLFSWRGSLARSKPWMPRGLYKERNLSD